MFNELLKKRYNGIAVDYKTQHYKHINSPQISHKQESVQYSVELESRFQNLYDNSDS